MNTYLIQIDGLTHAGAAQTIRLASHDDPILCHLAGQEWSPAISRLPKLRYDFFGGEFRNSITRPRAQFNVSIDGEPLVVSTRFAGARVRLWGGTAPVITADPDLDLDFIAETYFAEDAGGETGEIGPLELIFDGIIDSEPTIRNGDASFGAGPSDEWLDEPLLDLYAGTSGIEGPSELEGVPKPLILGNTRFAPGVLIDAVDNVYQVSGYGDIQAVNTVYDRVVSLGSAEGDYANLTALLAASLQPGEWATCLADGLVRLGAPADGTISFDVSGDNSGTGGYVRKPGAMIGRIAELAGGTTDSTNLAALDTARPYNLALVIGGQTTARQAIQEIADSVGATVGITWKGTLFVQAYGFGTSSTDLKSDGSSLPIVRDVAESPIGSPFWRLATNAEPTWVVHSIGEIGTGYILRGNYSSTRTYRVDDLVFATDGRAFVYIGTTPSAGNAPPTAPETANAYWRLESGTAQAVTVKTRTFVDDNEPQPIDFKSGDSATNSPSLTMDFTASFTDRDEWVQPTAKITAFWDASSAAWSESLADVTKTISGPTSLVLDYDSGGTLTTTIPKTSTYKISPAGGTALTSGVTWAVDTRLVGSQTDSDIWSGSVPSISGSGTGVLSLNSGLKISDATLEITATIAGVTYPVYTVMVSKVVASATPEGGSDFDSASVGGQSVNSTTYTQIAALTVTTKSGSTDVDLTANSIAVIPDDDTPTGAVNIDMKWQYESSPSTWTDVGSAASSDPDPLTYLDPVEMFYVPVNGSITCDRNQGSLSSSTSYNFRLMAKNSSGTKAHSFSGTVSAQG